MAFALKDRIQETTTTTGTGTITLAGAVTGFQSFAAVGNGSTTYYCITSGSAWEVGLGTYSTTGPTLARTTIYSNSLGTTAAISLTGTSNVFVTLPAQQIPGNGKFLQWQSVQTSNFTAVSGYAYAVDTTSAGVIVTLPASPNIGDVVAVVDYAGTSATNAIVIAGNGSNIQGSTVYFSMNIARQALNFVYIDAIQGWISYAQQSTAATFLSYVISYLVVAGGGGGGGSAINGGGAGAGGAGGYLSSTGTLTAGTTYTATVGAGGTAGVAATAPTAGTDSTLIGGALSVTAIGGGRGGYWTGATTRIAGGNGGSGGGAAGNTAVGSGTSGQGFAGGTASEATPNLGGGGGGGSASVGIGGNLNTGGNGGAGTASTITGASVFYAGGGGGGTQAGGTAGTGGSGIGGAGGVSNATGSDGTINTGSGGGGGGCTATLAGNGGAGGKGVVILSIPTYIYSGVTTGSPTVTTSGSNTILTFTSSGTYTA